MFCPSPIFSDSMDPVFRPTQQQLETVSCYSIGNSSVRCRSVCIPNVFYCSCYSLCLMYLLFTDLQPGELLFVPAGSPHKVENLGQQQSQDGQIIYITDLFSTSFIIISILRSFIQRLSGAWFASNCHLHSVICFQYFKFKMIFLD